jgi:5-methylcytosine-specific restriction endonuclease McrA
MKPHIKLYLRTFCCDETDFIPCEICHQKAVDIHHIECRGMGGTRSIEDIDNLMALCRKCHVDYGDKKQFKQWLKDLHLKKLIRLI